MRVVGIGSDGSHLELLNTVCLYWTAASVIIIIVTLLVKAPERHSAKFAFSHVSRRGMRRELVTGPDTVWSVWCDGQPSWLIGSWRQ